MENRNQEVQKKEPSKLERICKDLKTIVGRGGLRLEGLEGQRQELIEAEAGRLAGEMCQVVEQYVDFDEKGKIPDLTNKLEELTEEVVDKKELRAIKKISKSVAKGVKLQNRKRWILADEFSTTRVSADKLAFALTALAHMQKDKVRLLPEQIEAVEEARQKKLDEQKEDARETLTRDRRPLDGDKKKDLGNRAVGAKFWAARIIGILGALGLVYGAVAERKVFPKVWTDIQNWAAEHRPLGIKVDSALEVGRNDRYEQYLNSDEKNPTVAKVLRSGQWPDYNSQDIIGLLDPYSNEYSQWLAFVEWCGPQCFLDPNWIPSGRGQTEIMDLLGLTATEYQNYQQHSEKWPDLVYHLRSIYPDKPWLAELFSIRPTRSDLEGKSDFELWREKYKLQGKVDNGIRLSMLGKPVIRNLGFDNRFNKGQQQWRTGRSGGRGFGTPKGV